jgi:cytochrome c oxidase assembly protein subunit 11
MSKNSTQRPSQSPERSATRRDLIVAASCGAAVALMIAASFAAVPLYDWFCRTTGYGGRTQVATAAPTGMLDRIVTVRFDGNVAGGLPWRFEPERPAMEVRLGEVITLNYVVTNLSARETVGQASYNVTPSTSGIYFQKINCFCFTDQTLKAGEKREMAVVFYVDPALAKDAEQDGLNTITLSYTMHAVRKPVAESNGALPPGRS